MFNFDKSNPNKTPEKTDARVRKSPRALENLDRATGRLFFVPKSAVEEKINKPVPKGKDQAAFFWTRPCLERVYGVSDFAY